MKKYERGAAAFNVFRNSCPDHYYDPSVRNQTSGHCCRNEDNETWKKDAACCSCRVCPYGCSLTDPDISDKQMCWSFLPESTLTTEGALGNEILVVEFGSSAFQDERRAWDRYLRAVSMA